MAIRKIATIGHPVLRQKATEVSKTELASPRIQTLIDDLIETMRDAHGAGLAANQIYEPVAICAIEVRDNPRYPYKPNIPLTILVNPKITFLSDTQFSNFEGCLSVPKLRGRVLRHAEISVRAWDRFGHPLEFEVRGLSAGTYQHEVDHLNATIFVDRVTDPLSLCTWENFDRHHKARFTEEAMQLVKRWGA